MTEAEWVACEDAERMLVVLGHELQYPTRGLLPFVATFAESGRVRSLLPAHQQGTFDALVRWIHGNGPHPSKLPPDDRPFDPFENFFRARRRWYAKDTISQLADRGGATWFDLIALVVAEAYNEPDSADLREERQARPDTARWKAHQADRLREVVGNPFRPVAFSPSWRTDTALTLARQMHKSRDFSAMPILADALQDGGCDNEDILSHCRDTTQVHVRGCWVVDLVLDKE